MNDTSEFKPGDRIRINTVDGDYTGILMPRPSLTSQDHIMLKLDNGYNIGFKREHICSITLIEKNPKKEKQSVKEQTANPRKKTISILSTGGTISSKIDYRTGGVNASYTADDLLQSAPELREIANIKSRFLMNVMSEDMTPKLWVKMAKEAAKELNSGLDGVVITHGTDTMHYSTAALSFLLRDLGKPVVFTGSQRSSDRGSSDGFMNLICSVILAKDDVSGVFLVMHGDMEDKCCLAHKGTKVRKMHTSRRDAFKSINSSPITEVRPQGEVKFPDSNHAKRDDSLKVWVDSKLNEKVALIRVYPGMDSEIVDFYIDKGFKGIVFEGTALGHVPTNVEGNSLISKIERARDSGVTMVMVTQCLYGGVHPYVYANLREVSSRGVIYCGDMLPEVAYVKLMWVLGHTSSPGEIKEMMLRNFAGEISDKREIL